MSAYEPRGRNVSRVRERQQARQQGRRPSMASLPGQSGGRIRLPAFSLPGLNGNWWGRTGVFVRDVIWYILHTPTILMGIGAVVGLVFLLFVGSHVFSGRIFPGVWAAGVYLGDLTVDEAAAALTEAWENQVRITLADGGRTWTAAPLEMGLGLDAQKTAEAARGVGLSGIPFGYGVAPVMTLDYSTAQTYLLNLTAETDYPPYNAGYGWQNGVVSGILGRDGRMLDVPNTMQALVDDPVAVARSQRFDLKMLTLRPEVSDPEPYLEEAQEIIAQPFTLTGYDPFRNETFLWSTTPEVFASWLEAGDFGLTLRDDAFAAFLNAQNQSLNPPDQLLRYLDPVDTKDLVRAAIDDHAANVDLRIRYSTTQYEVVAGDTGFRIARKTGIPFYLIEEANPGRDLGVLSPGDILNIPSRDVTAPLEPVAHKRIVVNLDNQTLVAYENGQPVFHWAISSGLSQYPTSPGIFQVLSHEEIALGSSFNLCNVGGDCGQWKMNWFMGMYEVGPGLMNGFHGAVLLPNGTYLGGGNVGSPYTYGCVMSRDDQAKLLYDWAEQGTMVEVISSEYAPQSDLGQLTAAMPPGV